MKKRQRMPSDATTLPNLRASNYPVEDCTCTCEAPFRVRELEQDVLDLQRQRYARYVIPRIDLAKRQVIIERWGDGGGRMCFLPFDVWKQVASELPEHTP